MAKYNVTSPDGAKFVVEAPDDAPEADVLKYAQEQFSAMPKEEPYSGSVLPFSKDAQGKVSFDSNAGLLGMAKRAFTAPGDVLAGKLDPNSPEGQERAREMAGIMSPTRGRMVARPQKPQVPTAQELKDTAKQGYKAARDTGAEYPGAQVGALADDVTRALESDGIIAELSPQTFTILNKLRQPPDGSVASISSMDAARKALNRVAGNFNNPTEQEAARRVIERLDQFIQAGGQAPPVSGAAAAEGAAASTNLPRLGGAPASDPRQDAARLLTEARGNRAAAFRSDRLTGIEDTAELRASAANSGQNLGNTLRQRLVPILADPKKSRGFSEAELAAIRQVVEGTATSNTLRYVSNLLGAGGGLGQTLIGAGGAAGGAMAGGPGGAAVGMMALPLIGTASRTGANALTARQLRLADELVRKRSPLFEQRSRNPLMESRVPLSSSLVTRGGLPLLYPEQQ